MLDGHPSLTVGRVGQPSGQRARKLRLSVAAFGQGGQEQQALGSCPSLSSCLCLASPGPAVLEPPAPSPSPQPLLTERSAHRVTCPRYPDLGARLWVSSACGHLCCDSSSTAVTWLQLLRPPFCPSVPSCLLPHAHPHTHTHTQTSPSTQSFSPPSHC